ncbi:hypothetical protein QS257_09505 [Terrilactibacillus sp. S3-3]|nr:hypothetical protein QS257_09505 [Terrilactibacillus sp. S3-3]
MREIFIPVIGRMFTEATDTVVGASVLLKNTIGIAGLFILVCLIAFPLLKILSLALIYNIAAAILQPLGGGPVIDCLGIMAKSMIYIFAALAIVSLMFFFLCHHCDHCVGEKYIIDGSIGGDCAGLFNTMVITGGSDHSVCHYPRAAFAFRRFSKIR